MAYSLLTAVLVGLLAVLAIMLRGLYVMETKPDTELEARSKLDAADAGLRDTIQRLLPWRDS